jgi:hypothetical protein
MGSSFLPQRDSLHCDTCGRSWGAEVGADASTAMVVWQVDDQQRVTGLKLVCQGSCDAPKYRMWKSQNLSHFAGIDAAWDGVEEMFRSGQWSAPLRRKLLAMMRDASRRASHPPLRTRTAERQA